MKHRVRRRRRRLGMALVGTGLLSAAVVIIVAVSTLLAQGHRAADAQQDPKPTPSSGPTRHQAPGWQPTPAGELIPEAGAAYLGGYIQPATYNSAGEIAAVRSFQQQTGQQLEIVHVYRPGMHPFPTAADKYFLDSGKVLLLTWGALLDDRQIIAGRYDAVIRARAEALRKLGHPLLLQYQHEMDRPNMQRYVHGPKTFIAAWDHIRAIFQQVRATNVGWVWAPTGYGFQLNRAQAYYPGNSEVDWVSADVYSQSPAQSLAQAAAPFLSWARHTRKPVIIGEFGVGGDPSGWSAWLAAAGKLPLADPQIKAMAYYDGTGRDSQGNPFDYQLADNQRALTAFAQLMAAAHFHPSIRPGL